VKETLRIIAASALITGLLIKAIPALAEPTAATNVSIVRTSDLDLTSAAGRAQLDRRLVRAAWEVCGTASDADLAGKNDARECRAAVLNEARARSEALAAGRSADQTIRVAAR